MSSSPRSAFARLLAARGPAWLRVLTPFATAAIVFILGATAYVSTARETESTRLIEHTHEVIDGNQALLGRVVDAESGERGYIITGDSTYLTPYEGAATDARSIITRLQRLMDDDAVQRARIDTLGTLVDHRLATLRARVDARRRVGFAGARGAVILGSGEATMDSIRRVAHRIEAGERALMDERHKNAEAHARSVVVVIVAGTAAAIAIGLVLNLMLGRYAASQEEANRAKSEFLARMSHELRTPLNAIAGYVDLMQLGLRGPVTDAQLTDLARIKRSGRHLMGLIDNVLSYSKLKAGHLPLTLETLRVCHVLSEIDPFFAPQLEAKGLSFSADDCAPDLFVLADREKLDQILINLVTNACKYTPAGGVVSVRCEANDDEVHIHVCDTGRGIPPEKLAAIFEPFVQVNDSREPAGGVGLGLAIARELATAMGGALSAVSQVGVGSTFTLSLPTGATSTADARRMMTYDAT